jgi:aerotaxis receptor
MLQNISISKKLLIPAVMSSLVALVLGIAGVINSGRIAEQVRELYEENTTVIADVAEINDLMRENIQHLLLAVLHDPSHPASPHHNHPTDMHLDLIAGNIGKIGKLWQAYVARPLRDEERRLADEYAAKRKSFVEEGLMPGVEMAKGGRYSDLGIHVTLKVNGLFRTAKTAAEEVMNLEKRQAQAQYLKGMDRYRNIRLISIALVIIGLALSGGASWLFARSITIPLREMLSEIDRLTHDDTDFEVKGLSRKDEIGDLAQGIEKWKAGKIRRKELEQAAEAEQKARTARAERVSRLIKEFEGQVGTMLTAVAASCNQLHSSADTLSANAEQTSRQTQVVAQATEQANGNVATVAAAGTELSSSISEIARQVANQTEISNRAVAEAHATNERVKGLTEAAARIGDVVRLITDIASQTNLLALNATIEAARAGEAGKGFAVVANEVKHLANQTAKATEEISSQISTIQSETHEAVEAIQSIANVIANINELATAIASSVEEQGAATSEISRSVEEAAHGTAEVAQNIGDVAQAAGETGRMAHEVNDCADKLFANSNELKREVEKFLADVRAA